MEHGSRSDLRVTYFERTKLASKGPRPAEWRQMWRAWDGERARSIRSFFVEQTKIESLFATTPHIVGSYLYISIYYICMQRYVMDVNGITILVQLLRKGDIGTF
jgi:hypothetical protein